MPAWYAKGVNNLSTSGHMHIHINKDDRIVIQNGLRFGDTVTFIAVRISKDKSAISREIKRNQDEDGIYRAASADRKARTKRKKSKQKYRLIENDPKLEEAIILELDPLISPEVIAHEFKIHHQTIYSWLERSRSDLKSQLPQRGKRRRKYGSYREINTGWTKKAKSIHDRVELKENWEGDTMRGQTKPKVLTHVERRSLYTKADWLPDGTADAVYTKLRTSSLLGTITYDRGGEFALWEMIEKVLGVSIYFADPYQPGQRGKNENTNGRLRRVYPKGFDFSTITQRDLDQVVWKMNHTPRKSLSWRTPCEVYGKCCNSG